jgi:hypothetical protein
MALVNHYYFCILGRDFGPLFIKFCAYFPYPVKVCLNGYEWLKRQLAKRGMTCEALDIGNLFCGDPRRVQLIFDRRVTRRTPGRLWTRVLTESVVPSLHLQYKACDIKQYFKESRGLRTETAINNMYDVDIGRSLSNFFALRKIGFEANRHLRRVEQLGHDCLLGEECFRAVADPVVQADQKVSGLRFAEPRVMALMQALCLFALPANGFRHRDLRPCVAQLLGIDEERCSANQMTYDLRRLRLHGLIE